VAGPQREKNELRTTILKALANLTRICIMEKLREGPHSVSQLSERVQSDISTVSKHLSILKSAGLIEDKKEGTSVYYSLTTDSILDILASIDVVIRRNYEQYRNFFNQEAS
jgi:ArsR family transcriptional regulator